MLTAAIWLPATLAAGFFQAWRTALQQRLRGRMSIGGATLVRYLYGLPFALAALVTWSALTGVTPSTPTPRFLALLALGGLTNILGTALLIAAFGHRNFVVGTAFSKTEALQGAVFALVFLGETVAPLLGVGLAVGLSGVLLLSFVGAPLRPAELRRALTQPAALCGLGSGAAFGVTGVIIRSANQGLPHPDPLQAALLTLTLLTAMQSLMVGGWLLAREPGQLPLVLRSWRDAWPVGALSAAGSCGWYVGFITAPIALVRTVGQVEVLFTLAFAHLYLRERIKLVEAAGLLLVAAGVVLAIAAGRS